MHIGSVILQEFELNRQQPLLAGYGRGRAVLMPCSFWLDNCTHSCFEAACQIADGLLLDDLPGGDGYVLLRRACHDLNRQNGIATNGKEIVGYAAGLHTKNFLPYPQEHTLALVRRLRQGTVRVVERLRLG